MIAEIRLPYRVISKKNSKRIICRGRYPTILPSVAYTKFEKYALSYLEENCQHIRFTGPVKIKYIFEMKGKVDADIDNLQNGINDVLEKAKIIDNDKNVMKIEAEKVPYCDDFRTYVTIESLQNEAIPEIPLDNS